MILKASERGAAVRLGRHLTNDIENDHVEVFEVSGFIAGDVVGAMKEAQAVAAGTRCEKHLFSLSLNPPPNENPSTQVFERAIDRIETCLGLTGQPRVIVFHEKEGRRHAHAVWSRIDAVGMKAIELSFWKRDLQAVARETYLENGWSMPRGFVNSKERDPRSFDLAEWQSAKRTQRDAGLTKSILQECWAASDSLPAFSAAMEGRGFFLAKGDRRSFVAVTYQGEVLSLSRQIGRPAREVAKRLGKPDNLRSVDETKAHIATIIAPRMQVFMREADAMRTRAMSTLNERRLIMRDSHRLERDMLTKGQAYRHGAETKLRSDRLRRGALGVWDRITGRYAETRKRNETEAFACATRDRTQRDDLVKAQLAERCELQREIQKVRHRHATITLGLWRDLSGQKTIGRDRSLAAVFQESARAGSAESRSRDSATTTTPQRDRGPGLGG